MTQKQYHLPQEVGLPPGAEQHSWVQESAQGILCFPFLVWFGDHAQCYGGGGEEYSSFQLLLEELGGHMVPGIKPWASTCRTWFQTQ